MVTKEIAYKWDSNNQKEEILYPNGNKVNYTYNPIGNVTQVEKQRKDIPQDSGLFTYQYDKIGRLTSIANGNNVTSYTYDTLGNRLSTQDGNNPPTLYTYNARNQLVKEEYSNNVIKTYQYDQRGNLTTTSQDGNITEQYTYNHANLLTKATTPKGTAEYTYNGFKNRVGLKETLSIPTIPNPTKELSYILDLTKPYDNLIQTNGTHNQAYIWGNELLSANGDETYNYLQDHLGSPIRLVGSNTNNPLAYDVFGEQLQSMQSINVTNNPFTFTGYQVDGVYN